MVDQTPATYAATFATNVLGVLLSLKREIRVMLPQKKIPTPLSIIATTSPSEIRPFVYALTAIGWTSTVRWRETGLRSRAWRTFKLALKYFTSSITGIRPAFRR
jgi:hypothetical protein